MAVLSPSAKIEIDDATSHPWTREWHTPRFLPACLIQCFSGAMAVLLPLEIAIDGRCNIPPLDEGLAYTKISAGATHNTVLLRSDGCAVAIGENRDGQCNIPLPEPGICYVGDLTCGRDIALQVECVRVGDAVTLLCSTLAGEERFRLTRRERWFGLGDAQKDGFRLTHKRQTSPISSSFCQMGSCWPNSAAQIQGHQLRMWLKVLVTSR